MEKTNIIEVNDMLEVPTTRYFCEHCAEEIATNYKEKDTCPNCGYIFQNILLAELGISEEK